MLFCMSWQNMDTTTRVWSGRMDGVVGVVS
jgi:hypothetical protein